MTHLFCVRVKITYGVPQAHQRVYPVHNGDRRRWQTPLPWMLTPVDNANNSTLKSTEIQLTPIAISIVSPITTLELSWASSSVLFTEQEYLQRY